MDKESQVSFFHSFLLFFNSRLCLRNLQTVWLKKSNDFPFSCEYFLDFINYSLNDIVSLYSDI
jgi:uncharacterized membrane protein